MKILFEYYKNEDRPRVKIDGQVFWITETKSGTIESENEQMPLRYIEYELCKDEL